MAGTCGLRMRLACVIAYSLQGSEPPREGLFGEFSLYFMTFEPNPDQSRLSSSSHGTSPDSDESPETQLSPSAGVRTDVSTAALDRSMLLAATPPAAVYPPGAGPESQSDADIMLRVKAGDQSAFEYLV